MSAQKTPLAIKGVTLEFYKNLFNKIGWFIPSVNRGHIYDVANELLNEENPNIEKCLGKLYSKEHLSVMVAERFFEVPYIKEYRKIIEESVEAHFLGLDHIATIGLLPVVEGVGMSLVEEWQIDRKYQANGRKNKGVIRLFSDLIDKYKEFVISNELGIVGEIVATLDSFNNFLSKNFYANSGDYVQSDKTNRHGILHGVFKDEDYGTPLNFYKTIGAIEMLSFMISIKEPISFFDPEPSPMSEDLVVTYKICDGFKKAKRKFHG